MSNKEFDLNLFKKVTDFYIKDSSPSVYKNEYQNYALNLLIDFYDFYNKDNYFYNMNKTENDYSKHYNITIFCFVINYKNKNTGLYEMDKIFISPEFFSLLLNTLNELYINNNTYTYNHKCLDIKLTKEFDEFFYFKYTEIEKKEIEDSLNKENVYIGKHKFDYDRINSGNFTDYELSTMYSQETIEKYKGKDINTFRKRI